MVQVNKRRIITPYKKFESCRLHDLMRDLCSSKAKDEKFIKRLDISKHQHDIPSAIGASMHRVAINIEDDYASLGKNYMAELKDLRFVLLLCKNRSTMGAIDFANIIDLGNSKHLRILALLGVKLDDGNLSSTIGKQIYLKYLSLHRCEVKELSQHICNMSYLQTLDLRVWISSKFKLPNLIWKLKRLKHLFLPSEIEVTGGDKLKLDGLNELETLQAINSKSVRIIDVINLRNLRSLRAAIEEDMDCLSKIVEQLRSNQCQLRETSLEVVSCDLRNILESVMMIPSLIFLKIVNCEIGSSFPSYRKGMSLNLGSLGIVHSKIVGNVIEVLGKFPMLQHLWLVGDISEEDVMTFDANSFPELTIFDIDGLMNLHKWEVEKGATPKLRELWIWNCINLERLPDGVRFITTLQELKCYNMSEEFRSKYMRGGENGEGRGQDYANFSHIPSLSIR